MTGPRAGAGPVGLAVTRSVVRTAAVLTAAGSGSRLGLTVPKALALLDGTPLVGHAARRLVASGVVDLLVVTVPDGHLAAVRDAVDDALRDVPGAHAVPVLCTVGGPSRQASVAAALAHLEPDVDVVLVHDAARALAPPELVAAVVAAVRSGSGAVVPALPVTDTIAEVEPGAGTGRPARVVATPDRSRLRAVQTPQGFDRALLDRAHAAASGRAADEALSATDDSSLVALLGEPVVAVPGDDAAMKVTTQRDLAVASLLLRTVAVPGGTR
ncbi:2-C-methyl-D-erythritol 4-phosphate cytidylyltransferase [Cellulomonas aerilata]|uniref:2-C-methyl-D-erythritol 4-phosphate cytidylyltransferase n=1 Tax=Cellulomonas aerilata TaxID=515326 RepID=A0A512DEG4_9CELL|nr:2-C-methyl-D-erythritol 4-phosphate cytidylyltransferase [Cellulomonas aerilata]GEO34858.1 2-C-methyl-D-erythritol 4-phosphate cytidylyltransferase [Cellulomonas aerilata]